MKTKRRYGDGIAVVLRAYREDPSRTMRELAEATGYSLCAVHHNIHALMADGVIEYENKPVGKYERKAKKTKAKAFQPKNPTKVQHNRRLYEAECFERAVAMGLKHDAEIEKARRDGVFHDNKPLFRNGTLNAYKVG